MAPEIFFHPKNILENPIYTEKADIFSLAVIIHEIIYDIHPFDYN
jgi:serine/threonine protein kinase